MEDTYLLYLPAEHSPEHVAAPELIINDYTHRVKIHTDIQSSIEAYQIEMDSVIYIYQA